MAKQLYVGVSNKARKSKKAYIGVSGIARKIKKMYVGVNGIAKCFFNSLGISGLIAGGQGHFMVKSDDPANSGTYNRTATLANAVTSFAAAYGNDTIVVVGSGTSSNLYSKDGHNWTAISALAGARLYDIAFCDDRFVAVGEGGVSYYSFDGVSWTAYPALGNTIKSICYNADYYRICVCRNSDDGSSASFNYMNIGDNAWTRCMYGVSYGGRLPSMRSLAWTGTHYVMGLQYNVYSNAYDRMDGFWTDQNLTAELGSRPINRMLSYGLLPMPGTSSNGGDVFIVGGKGLCKRLVLASDGVIDTLEALDVGTTDDNIVIEDFAIYDGVLYVCARSNPAVIYRHDGGTSWTPVYMCDYVSGNYVYFNYLCAVTE